MKDAKGHGSNARGLHSAGIDKIPGWGPVTMMPINKLKPRPENSAMIAKFKALDASSQAAFEAAYPGEKYTPQPGDMRYKVEGIRETLRQGGRLPPLAVNSDGSIEDGENRWMAYKAEGIKMVPVRVRK